METEGVQGAYRGPRSVCTLMHKPEPGFHHSPQCHQQILGPSSQDPQKNVSSKNKPPQSTPRSSCPQRGLSRLKTMPGGPAGLAQLWLLACRVQSCLRNVQTHTCQRAAVHGYRKQSKTACWHWRPSPLPPSSS